MASPTSSPFENDSVSRCDYIGGSEAFELLSEKQYGKGCARALAYRKLQTPEDVPTASARDRAVSMRAIMNRGHLMEDLAARLYMDATGRAVIRRLRLVRNVDHPGAGVHTDRIILAHRVIGSDEMRPTGDCEIKSHAEGPFLNILRNGLPAGHNLQLQWSLFCTGHTWGAFVILGVFGELPLKHFDIERDPTVMNIFAAAVDDFWNTLAAGELPPQLPDADDIRCRVCPFRLTCRGESLDPEEYRRLMDERQGKRALVPVNDEELDQALADRALIMSEIEALSNESDKDPGALQLVTRRIKELLGSTEAAIVNRHWKVYCSENSWSGLDTQRLKAEQPGIYKKYYIEKRATGTKRLKVYAMRDGRTG
jgi:predicted phage-related endonuclease